MSRSQGTMYLQNNELLFKPNIFPTTVVKKFGFSWDKQLGVWRSPAVRDSVHSVLEIFPEVTLDNTLREWLDTLKVSEQKVASRNAVELDGLFPYQRESVNFLTSPYCSSQGALLALAPGLGKTVCAIKAAVSLEKQRILVVSPLSLLYNWRNEIVKWTGCPESDILILHKDHPSKHPRARWNITNYETLRKEPTSWSGFDCIISDESVLIKNRDARRTRAIWAVRSTNKTAPMWLLSGAPITKYYDDLWSQFRAISYSRFSSYWSFARSYCEFERNIWGTSISGNKPNAEQMIKRDLRDIYMSCTQDDVLDLPEFLFENTEIQLGKAQSRAYEEMEANFITHLHDLGEETVLAPNTLSQMMRLMQLASSPMLVGGSNVSAKADAVLEMMEFIEKPVIMWTCFIATAGLLVERLTKAGYSARQLTGSTPTKERQGIVDDFQAGKLDVIVAHPAVGKFGLTLTKGRTAIYVERSFNGDDYYQSLYRIRRIGTKYRPHIIHMMALTDRGDRTIDHTVSYVLGQKYNNVQKITAGDILRNLEGGKRN